MAGIDELTLRALSARAGLPMQFVFKEIKLLEALSGILSANRDAGLRLVMKGGTALNKIYLRGVQRFSEDIDFDLFSETNNLKKIVAIDGFETQGPWRRRDTIRYHLAYNFAGQADTVRVEFSTGKLLKTVNPVANENVVSDITGNVLYGAPVYSLDDLVARKMNALRTRTEGKDVWDCHHAIPKTKKLKDAISHALLSEKLSLSAEEALGQTIAKLGKIDPKRIMKLTNPYIPASLRPDDWQSVVDELTRQIEMLLKPD
ncbi:hypothetical protein COT30_00525 [Candidatus Micrarchaeota archaeon CG08_land_8_20_14_0_20_49_17]|nr:MAG: hypothetical protein COT30_00525 [Candidatus Micrarchaeota archaeon CG08_land_8_20_14_0_20_49_17]PIU82357.1 MAG: hypothetical protein COS70_01745 [Candidatus Micrarchaeota archaeon CG06_land_8_20_14_3_00_50_6]PIZ96604.1 MAG: hypothetical protein COX84_03765 [Candidatus Micrarchaeota archaeon CG_4_10_14_0_2_um_filter_49_7]HII53383.1 hypothetical protein [Candidatus Micrarchaeota archaeon]